MATEIAKNKDENKEHQHQDFGEKIGGARKDQFLSRKNGFSKEFFDEIAKNLGYLNSMEQEEFVSKANIFKPINVQQMRDNGVEDPASIKYMQSIRSAISARPKIIAKDEDVKSYLELYINFVKYVETVIIEASQNYSAFEDVQKHIDDNLKFYLFKETKGSRKLQYTDEGKLLMSISAFSNTLFDRLYNKFRDKIDYKNTTWEMLLTKKGGTRTVRKESIKNRLKGLEHLDHVRRNGIVRRLGEREVSTDEIHQKFSFRGGEFGNWLSQKERGEVLNMAYDALLDLSDVIGAKDSDISLDSSLSIAFGSRGKGRASAHYEPMRRVINLTRMSGAGSLAHEWFHALDNYMGSFKFTEDSERAGVLEYVNTPSNMFATAPAYLDNFQPHPDRGEDVERILKVRDMLSNLGMKLKYKEKDPIELAKGLTSLTQLKNKMKRQKRRYRKDYYQNKIVSLEIKLGKTDYFKHAELLDGDKKKYFSDTVELGARAFESYVLDELESREYKNDYLVASTKKSIFIDIETEASPDGSEMVSPYPQGEEREAFRQEFRKIMDVMFPDGERMAFKKDFSYNMEEKEERKVEAQEKREKEQAQKKSTQLRQLSLF